MKKLKRGMHTIAGTILALSAWAGHCAATPETAKKTNVPGIEVNDCSALQPEKESGSHESSIVKFPLVSPPVADSSVRPSDSACSGLCVRSNPTLEINLEGEAVSTLKLCNDSTTPHRLRLSASDFAFADRQGLHKLSTTAKFSGVSPDDQKVVERISDIEEGKCVAINVEVEGFGPAVVSAATLSDAGKDLAQLFATRLNAPFNVKVDSKNPNRADLAFVKGEPTALRLRNEDPLLYRVLWELSWDERVAHGCTFLEPNSNAEISLTLADSLFGFFETGLLRSGTHQGKLTVRHMPDDSARNLPMKTQSFESTSKLSFAADEWQTLGTAATILVLLVVGVLASLLVNFGLPMQRKKVTLKQQLAELDGLLNGQANVIGGRVVNALRVEQRRLRAAIEDQSAFVPEAEIFLPIQAAKISALAKRVDIAKSVGNALTTAQTDPSLAQHETESIVRACLEALAIVENAASGEPELVRAQGRIAEIAEMRKASSEPPDDVAVTELEVRAKAVRATFGALAARAGAGAPTEADIATWAKLEELLGGLRTSFKDIRVGMPRKLYVLTAKAVRKAEAIDNYARLVASAETGPVFRGRIDRAADLLAALSPGPEESILIAARLLSEVEQNISKRDLINAVSPGPPALYIEVDPAMPREFQTTTLRLRFRNPGYDAAEARYSLACRWKVDNASLDGDDFVAHYFFEGPESNVNVSVELYDGEMQIGKALTVGVKLAKSERLIKSSTWLSLASLAVTVAVVTLGLMTAAQDKLQSVSWLAGIVTLLALGFGADVIKRSLSKPQESSS